MLGAVVEGAGLGDWDLLQKQSVQESIAEFDFFLWKEWDLEEEADPTACGSPIER